MAQQGRGGVGIRLFVEGDEVVRRTFDQVGDSGRKMWAELAVGQKSANPAIRALSVASNEAQGAVHGLAGRAGAAGSTLVAFGAAGVALAAGLGGALAAINSLRDGMQFAAELTDVSDRIGIGAEALQELRFAADETGVPIQALEAGLERLNNSLGAFKSGIGAGRITPVFKALGIEQEDLANIHSANDLLPVLADSLGQVEDRALQVRLAKALGIEELLPLLRAGTDGMGEMAQEARRLGLVMSDEVRRELDEADRALEVAEHRIRMGMMTAVAGLADEMVALANATAGTIRAFAAFFELMDRMEQRGQARTDVNGRFWLNAARGDFAGAARAAQGHRDIERARRGEADLAPRFEIDRAAVAAVATPASDITDGLDLDFDRGGGRRSGGANAAARAEQQRQRERDRALQDFDRQEQSALREAARVRWGSVNTAEGRWALAQANYQLEFDERETNREQLRLALEKANLLTDENRMRWEALRNLDAEIDQRRQDEIELERRHGLRQEELRGVEIAAEDQIADLELGAATARTAAERFELERRIVELSRDLERQRLLVDALEDGEIGDAEQANLDAFDRDTERQIKLIDFNEEERLREIFVGYGRDLADAIVDGDLEGFFRNLGRQFLDQAVTNGLDSLFDSLGGGSKTGGGGWMRAAWDAVTSIFGGGRASGGDLRSGYRYQMTEHGAELAVFGRQGHVLSHADTVDLFKETVGATSGGKSTGVTVQAHYAPVYHVQGSGPEIDRLRSEMERDRAGFHANVVAAVNDGISRREIG